MSSPELTQLPALNGQPQPPDSTYFAPPPPEIGNLLAAQSTLKVGMKPKPLMVRLLISFSISLLIAALWCILLATFKQKENVDPRFHPIPAWINYAAAATVLFIVSFPVVLPLVLYFTRFTATCDYIGQLGVVRFTLSGNLSNRPKSQGLLFSRAAELRNNITRQFVNGIYAGTKYHYKWTDDAGKPVCLLSGSFMSSKDNPPVGNQFHFGRAAELAWSQYLLNRSQEMISESGSLRFNLDPKRQVLIGPGFIEFQWNGRTDRCEAHEIKVISLNNGTFSIHHMDARWYSSKGKFTFPYAQLANARLFLLTLDRFLPSSTWGGK